MEPPAEHEKLHRRRVIARAGWQARVERVRGLDSEFSGVVSQTNASLYDVIGRSSFLGLKATF